MEDRFRTVVAVNCAACFEKASESIVPAVYSFIAASFQNLGPANLGLITFARALSQALFSPIGGIAG